MGLCISFSRRVDLIVLVAFAITATSAGCAQVDVVAEREMDEIREGGADDAENACDQRGPRVRLGDNAAGANLCEGGSIRAFRHALCVCSDYTAGARLTIDAFDSSQADSEPLSEGGSVGINGELQNDGYVLAINGSLRVDGGRDISLSGNAEIQVGQELEVQSAILGEQASVTVGGDARIGGDVRLAAFRVDGTLSIPGDAELTISETSRINTVREEPIQVEPPCGCAEEDIVDIPALVAKASEDNDNALLDFDINELENFTGPVTRRFPCGRFYLRRLNGTGALVLSITGRAALYVAEHVDFQDRVTVDLGPEAEFELYLADSMVASSDLTFGSADSPARARLFVGGSGTLEIQGENRFSGQIYAPRSELVVSGATEIYGSVFVRRSTPSAPLTIHYDRNPIEAGQICSE
jgi:cytoskeletal protein CcmA (bactofilin family)